MSTEGDCVMVVKGYRRSKLLMDLFNRFPCACGSLKQLCSLCSNSAGLLWLQVCLKYNLCYFFWVNTEIG